MVVEVCCVYLSIVSCIIYNRVNVDKYMGY